MSYVEKVLASDERLVHMAQFHWSYTLGAVLALIFLTPLLGLGIIIFLVMMIRKWTTEMAVTDRRLIVKRGWISRKSEEISLGRLEEVNFDQSILGRILGYGTIRVAGTGVSAIEIANIDDPLGFRRALEEARGTFRRNQDD